MHPQNSVGAMTEEVPLQTGMGGIVLAQCVGVSADDHAIQVIFTTLSGILTTLNGNPLKVRVLQRRAGTSGAILELPQMGEWGLVCFPSGSDQMAVWLGSLSRDLSNLSWDGVGPLTQLDQHESGVYRLLDDAGNLDLVFADGSYLRVGAGTVKATRLHHERQGQQRRTTDFSNPQGAPGTMYLQHVSGTTVQIDPNGDATITGAGKITVTATGDILVQSAGIATIEGGGPAQSLLGGDTDFLVLLQGLINQVTWLSTHVHTGVQGGSSNSGPPATPPPVLVDGVDYTTNAKAS